MYFVETRMGEAVFRRRVCLYSRVLKPELHKQTRRHKRTHQPLLTGSQVMYCAVGAMRGQVDFADADLIIINGKLGSFLL